MSRDRSYVDQNTRERERLRTLIERLSDAELQRASTSTGRWPACWATSRSGTRAFSCWPTSSSVACRSAIRYRDGRCVHATAPREAARLALRLAEDTDDRIASLEPGKLWPNDPDSPLNPLRADHRGEHLAEIEAALRRDIRLPSSG